MKKIGKYKLIILFLAFLFTIPILTAISGDTNISTIENRTLAPLPIYSKENLFNGDYFNQWENYISDHIISRDSFIKSYTLLNMNVLGKHRINDIVLGSDDTLLPYYTDTLSQNLIHYYNNLPTMAESLGELSKFVESNGGELLFVGLPSQSSFFRDRYISYFSNKDSYLDESESKLFSELDKNEVNYINMNEIFRNDYKEDYYLKTDHHFSFKGSFKTYEEIIKKTKNDLELNIESEIPLDKFDLVTLENPIQGSRNRQLYYLKDIDEKLTIAYHKNEIEYEKYVNGGLDNRLYYVSEDPSVRPTYGVYMNGDFAEISIDTNREELPNLLIFGDSFTNALEPLLYYHFNETRILDLRHYTKMNLYEYIDLHKPDMVIMVRDELNYGNLNHNGIFK
ncbi:DHHW family protein [Tissierella sp.]|uniref:DHHW family protein n=1 Tax=Tissierella sp. TaxID=41274 RepID=UPI00285DEDA7|nr:DHHW family protein [Tissierella sp.]MDR7857530.1 hypothetical protein [Tissierella sp.]